MKVTETNEVWVIDDDKSIRWVLEKALKKADMEVVTFENGDQLLNKLGAHQPDAILSDVRMPGIDGFELLKLIKEKYSELPVIIMTAHSDLDSAVSAYHRGAFEYLPKPFDIKDAVDQVKRACRVSKETQQPADSSAKIETEIIGEAPAMQEVYRAIGRMARSNVTVLINGESGTGKELVAKALHNHSLRKDEAFIALNMAAIPRDLLESELFGHEKGAFTGAQSRRKGRFEQAHRGTLFLDEIGDMPAELQTRLLRVLADGQFYPVGSHEPVSVDVRIIAATHQDLEKLVHEGKFREDLFHRLNVIRIQIPALRERAEDIPLLMEYFLQQSAEEMGMVSKRLKPDAIEALTAFSWPGNVRQLENASRWITVMAAGQDIHVQDLPEEIRRETSNQIAVSDSKWQSELGHWVHNALRSNKKDILSGALPEFERVLINEALEYTAGKKQEAALLLGWGRNTLTRKMKELNFSASASKENGEEVG
ncbi:MAG: nitrogen regulation protein NR(I) [Gammaproteobacteria bacterium]|nr:nitrogen regulation protein NR(I) [Gammaproteobacteria bacterium]